MIYKYIKNIDKTDRFIYAVVMIFSIVIATRLPLSTNIVLGILVGGLVIFYINDKTVSKGDSFISSMKKILSSDIMNSKDNNYLSKDSELLIFLDEYDEYSQYNPGLWNTFVKQINNFLRLINDIEIGSKHYNLDYDVIKDINKKILNTYHSFIYKIPHTQNSTNKFHDGFNELQKLLNNNIDKIHRTVVNNNKKEINIDTKFHYKNHLNGLTDNISFL